MNKLTEIQQKLKAPKSQYNKFGKYNYRNCEDILEAVKPLLGDCGLIISDSIVQIGDRYYVQASVTFSGDGDPITVTALARESETKKGMDDAQVTGGASSYARKYALNGLFLIDDTKDADSTNTGEDKPVSNTITAAQVKELNVYCVELNDNKQPVWSAVGVQLLKAYKISKVEELSKAKFSEAMARAKKAWEKSNG